MTPDFEATLKAIVAALGADRLRRGDALAGVDPGWDKDNLDAGVMVRTTGDTLALSPPLIVEKSQIDQLVSTIGTALRSVA